MARYLFDTNHLSAAIDDEADVRDHIFQLRRPGHRLGTCVPVLCERETGLQRTHRREHNRRLLITLLRQIRIWLLEPPLALVYAEIFHDLRARGRVLSQVDMMLAALSRSMDAVLLTDDRDFEALPDLQIENWLK
ncbi:MAG TPA: type II toxin-antitoxin system VapC family toxin [Isosphaeraceae bacterium]|nr:type II toxin-antitoxin system VapC family toxin [Isosphaeraceae bacterium]